MESTEKTKSTATICQITDLNDIALLLVSFSSKLTFILCDISKALLII